MAPAPVMLMLGAHLACYGASFGRPGRQLPGRVLFAIDAAQSLLFNVYLVECVTKEKPLKELDLYLSRRRRHH